MATLGKTLALLIIASACLWWVVDRTTCNRCDLNAGYLEEERARYFVLISSLHRRVVDLTSPSSLFGFEEFIELYENPLNDFPYAIDLIRDPAVDSIEKQIAIYSMTRLPTECYVRLVEECYRGYRDGRVSGWVLRGAIIHDFGRRRAFVDHADRDDAQNLIRRMLGDESLPAEVRKSLRSIQRDA